MLHTYQCECQMFEQFHQHFQQLFHFLSNKLTSHCLRMCQLSANQLVQIITNFFQVKFLDDKNKKGAIYIYIYMAPRIST